MKYFIAMARHEDSTPILRSSPQNAEIKISALNILNYITNVFLCKYFYADFFLPLQFSLGLMLISVFPGRYTCYFFKAF